MYCVKQRKDMVNFTRFDSIISLASYFSNEEICRQFLKEQRWGSVVVCPYCGSVHVYACGDGKRFKCDGCGNKFSVLVGTIFENTKLPLRKWFMAMYLLSSHKKGVSSHQIARDIEVTQKTAWFILHKIRTLLGQDDNVTLADEVECDEAYMGGREKNKHEDGGHTWTLHKDQDARVRNGAERRKGGSQEGCRHWLQHPFGSHTTVCEAGLTHLHR